MAILYVAPSDTPAATPPPGVTPNFLDPYSKGPLLVGVGSVLLFLMLLSFGARIFTKYHIIMKRSWDDWFCAAAAIGTVLYFINLCFASTMGKFGTHTWNVPVMHLSKKSFIMPAFFAVNGATPVWLSTKLTFLLLYLRIFRPMKWFRYCIYLGITVITLFYTVFTVAQLCSTTPRPGQEWAKKWQQLRYLENLSLSIPVAAVGFGFDIFIFILPIAGIFQLQLSRRSKVGVARILIIGVIVCITSTLKLIYLIKLSNDRSDFLWGSFETMFTGFSEMCVSIIATCMPCIFVLTRHPRSRSLWASIMCRSASTTTSTTNLSHRSGRQRLSADKARCNNQLTTLDGLSSPEIELPQFQTESTLFSSGKQQEGQENFNQNSSNVLSMF